MEVKMWRCYTATTIQSIRVMVYYSQRGFNKVNLVAQRTIVSDSRRRTKTLLFFLSLLSIISMCTRFTLLLLSLSSHHSLNIERSVLISSCRRPQGPTIELQVWNNLNSGMFSALFPGYLHMKVSFSLICLKSY